MGITYGGMPLVLDDPDDRVADWFDSWIPYQDIRSITDWSAGVHNPLPAGVSQPNWSAKITPRLNTWYSPTGASRWGFGFFLADGTTKAALIAAEAGTGAPLNLTTEYPGQAGTLGRSMVGYLLPPHPVGTDNADVKSLWLLPIVDSRYFWQFKSIDTGGCIAGITTIAPFTTWLTLFQNIMLILGPDIFGATIPTINTAYLNPNQWDLVRLSNYPAPVVLDICLASVGMRLVPDDLTLGGGAHTAGKAYSIQDYPTAQGVRDAGFAPSEVAGALQVGILNPPAADLASIQPTSVNVAFRYYAFGLINPDALNAEYLQNVTPSAAGWGGLQATGPPKLIRTRALANNTNNALSGGAGAPDNSTTIMALATQIATDCYGWLSWFQDQAYIGVSRQRQTGFDDYREYAMWYRTTDGLRIGRTRVATMPHNFYQDDLLHWDPTVTPWTFTDPTTSAMTTYNGPTWEYGNVITGLLSGLLTAKGTAPNGTQVMPVSGGDLQYPTGTDGTNPYSVLQVSEILGNQVNPSNVIAIRDGARWGVIEAPGGEGVYVRSATVVKAPGLVTVTIYSGTLGSETTTGITVSAYLRNGLLQSGVTYLCGLTTGGLEILNPTLRFRGTTNADIASHAAGTCLIYVKTAVATYTTTTVNTGSGAVYNGLDQTSKSGSFVEVVWEGFFVSTTWTEGWTIIQSDFSC